jgi:hypothetical protein
MSALTPKADIFILCKGGQETGLEMFFSLHAFPIWPLPGQANIACVVAFPHLRFHASP